MNNLIGWTSWYCPVKQCGKIIYNTNLGARDQIDKHIESHRNYTPLKVMLESEYKSKIISLFLGILTIEIVFVVLYKAWPKLNIPLDKYITFILQWLKYGH